MEFVIQSILIVIAIIVRVHLVSMVKDVKMIIDFVKQKPAQIAVSISIHIHNIFLLFIGTCIETSNTTFRCECSPGWEGTECATTINENFCHNVTCLNQGACRNSPYNYTCACLGDYYGLHCEFQSTKLRDKKKLIIVIVSVICSLIALLALIALIIKLKKHYHNIDLMEEQRRRMKERKMYRQANRVCVALPAANPRSKVVNVHAKV